MTPSSPRRIRRILAVPFAAAVIAIGFAGALATSASAATAPTLPVTLSACGTGSSAVWNAAGNPVLTIGTAPAATCGAPAGSTYNPAYAQVTLKVAGQPVPVSEPAFTTDNYASGSPRIEIDLNNGHTLTGYPAASGLNGTDMAWASDIAPNTYGAYTTAYTATNANTTTVKDAYIVEDADQTSGTADTLTNIQFGGAVVQATSSNPVQVKNRATGKCLNENQANGLLSTFTCLPQTYVSLQWKQVTFADGSKYLMSVQTGQFVKDGAAGAQLSLTGTPTRMTFGSQGVFGFPANSLVMTVNQGGNFAPVVGEPGGNPLDNGRWDFGAV